MEITVNVSDVTRKLVLREFIGDGHCAGYEFAYSSTLPDRSIYVTVDGKNYLVDASEVIQAVIAEHHKKGEL